MDEKEKRLKKIEERMAKKKAMEAEEGGVIFETSEKGLAKSKSAGRTGAKGVAIKSGASAKGKRVKEKTFKSSDNVQKSKDRSSNNRAPKPLMPVGEKMGADVVTKMIVIGVISIAAILVLASVYVAVVSGDRSHSKKKTTNTEAVSKAEEQNEVIDYDRMVAVIKHIDIEEKKIVVHDINNYENKTYTVPSGIEIKDAYGTDIALSQLDNGDLVEIKAPEKGGDPEYIKITATAWERTEITGAVIDTAEKTIKIKNDKYKYTDEIVALEDGKPFDLSTLSLEDKISIRGYSNMVWSLNVTGRHGKVKLINYENFLGGTLDIVGHVSKDIVSNMVLSLPAGSYNVTISKEGFPPTLKKVTVVADEEVVLDLGDIQAKVGEVEFVLENEEAEVYLGEKKIDIKEKQVLDFGSYDVIVKLQETEIWRGELLVNKAYLKYKIDLSEDQHFIYFNEPEGSDVYFDGVLVGTIPTKAVFVSGSHKIQLRQDGYRTSETYNYLWCKDDKDKYLIFPDLVPLVTTTEEIEQSTTVPEPTRIGEVVYTDPETTTSQSSSDENAPQTTTVGGN